MKIKYLKQVKIVLFLCICGLLTSCSCQSRYLPTDDPPPPPCFVVPEKIRVALVLGSGGVRGMAHVGVLEVLEDAGIPIDIIVGCSAGSLVGALYADNPHVDAVKKAVAEMRTQSLLDINLWNCRFGLCQGKTLRKILCTYLTATTFEELKIPLITVATDLHSGELVPLASGNIIKAVEASCAIPFVFVPVELNGRILVDGGTINPVPVVIARDLDADIVIAVDLCELLPSTFPANLLGVASRSAEIAFLWQNEVCTRHADIVIRPKMCGVGTFNDQAKYTLYCAGREAALEALPHIQEILNNFSQPYKPCTEKRTVQLHCYNSDYWSCKRWFN
jgi:NTE family protein